MEHCHLDQILPYEYAIKSLSIVKQFLRHIQRVLRLSKLSFPPNLLRTLLKFQFKKLRQTNLQLLDYNKYDTSWLAASLLKPVRFQLLALNQTVLLFLNSLLLLKRCLK